MFRLALKSGNIPVAADFLDNSTQIDEQDYLASNDDVSHSVAGKEYSSGLAHYICSGEKEGRPGFTILLALQEALQIHCSSKVALDAMQRLLRSWIADANGKGRRKQNLDGAIGPDNALLKSSFAGA